MSLQFGTPIILNKRKDFLTRRIAKNIHSDTCVAFYVVFYHGSVCDLLETPWGYCICRGCSCFSTFELEFIEKHCVFQHLSLNSLISVVFFNIWAWNDGKTLCFSTFEHGLGLQTEVVQVDGQRLGTLWTKVKTSLRLKNLFFGPSTMASKKRFRGQKIF